MARRRESFDEVAELYDSGRPAYPDRVVEDLMRLCRVRAGSRVLEIGAGSGQLTVPLAAVGAEITALELGPNLAGVARRRLAGYRNAEVIAADFDQWFSAGRSFDLVVAATSFHWLDPKSRVGKCADLLSVGGSLAIIHTSWGVRGTGDEFAHASQACHERWDPEHEDGFQPPRIEDLPDRAQELRNSHRFGSVEHRQYPVHRAYATKQYVDLLATFSNVLALKDPNRHGFMACIGRLIDGRFGGRVERLDVYDMWIAESSGRSNPS